MKEKKYLFYILSLTLTFTLMIVPVINFKVDPLQIYRQGESDVFAMYPLRYANISKVKNSVYDGLLVGTSMLNEFDEDEISKQLGMKVVKANMAGSSSAEQKILIQSSIDSKSTQNFFWEMNYDVLSFPHQFLPPKNVFPIWAYEKGHYFDLYFQYLVNFQTLRYSKKVFSNKSKKQNKESNITHYTTTLTKEMAKEYLKREKKRGKDIPPHAPEHMIQSFKKNYLNIIDNNPEVKFVLFFSPQSIYYLKRFELIWDNGNESIIKLKEVVYSESLKRNNLKLFDFQTDSSIVSKPENFRDIVHHNKDVADLITSSIISQKYMITNENKEENLKKFQAILLYEN